MALQLCFISAAAILVVAQGVLVEDKAVKGGTCPAASPYPGPCVFNPKVNCLADSACPDIQKCCPEGCGRVCKLPCPLRRCSRKCKEYARNARGCLTCRCKTPVCPLIKCSNNCDQYVLDKNGCRTCQCVQKPKPGVCPKPPHRICVRAIFECRQDGDCSGDKKCCRVPCGTECSSPVKTAELQSSDKTDCQIFSCFVNPCQFAKCSVPGAVCVPNYCGGCFAHFFNEKGHRVCNGGAS